MKYLLILLFLFSTQVFSDNRVKSYTANTIVRYTAADDVLPYGYQLALRCGDIPITINLSINKNIVNGEVINNYSELNNYISDKECTSFHSGKLNGKFDKRGKFKQVFIKHPTSSFNLHGFYRLDGTIDKPKLIYKNNSLFKAERFEFNKTESSRLEDNNIQYPEDATILLDLQNKFIKLKEQITNVKKEILELDKLIKIQKEILIEE